jgi:hypothetical protein
MAAGVQPDAPGEASPQTAQRAGLDEELAELAGPAGSPVRAPFGEKMGEMPADVGGAAARGRHDEVVAAEDLVEAPAETGGLGALAGRREGLTAAGLRLGELEGDAERVEEADHRDPHLGAQLIDVAGDEQADRHRARGLRSRGAGRRRRDGRRICCGPRAE